MEHSTRAQLPMILEDLGTARGSEATAIAEFARFETADFDFRQLHDWYRGQVSPVVWGAGVTMTDIDERRNRIVIGVAESERIPEVRARLLAAGVPEGVWEVVVSPPIRAVPPIVQATSGECDPEIAIEECDDEPTPPGWWSLREKVRGARGGLQITNISSTALCSIGFNLVLDPPGAGSDPARYFVTASHCTNISGVLSGVGMGQAGQADFLGTEILDPPYTSVAPLCPSGFLCRYSDAALFEYGTPSEASGASIAWPTSLGGLIFSSSHQVTQLEAFPLLGMELQKVGRTTGRSAGQVTQTCVDVAPSGPTYPSGAMLLCQGLAAASAASGDSGGPVVRVLPSGALSAVGVLWGETEQGTVFAFSHIGDVLLDLTEAGGATPTPVF